MSTWLIILLVIVGVILLLLAVSKSFRAFCVDGLGEIIEVIVDLFD